MWWCTRGSVSIEQPPVLTAKFNSSKIDILLDMFFFGICHTELLSNTLNVLGSSKSKDLLLVDLKSISL